MCGFAPEERKGPGLVKQVSKLNLQKMLLEFKSHRRKRGRGKGDAKISRARMDGGKGEGT